MASKIINQKEKPAKIKIKRNRSRTPISEKTTPILSKTVIQDNKVSPNPVSPSQSPTSFQANESSPIPTKSIQSALSSPQVTSTSPRTGSPRNPMKTPKAGRKLLSPSERTFDYVPEENNQVKSSTETVSKISIEHKNHPNPSQIRQERISKINEMKRQYVASQSPVQQLQINIKKMQKLIDDSDKSKFRESERSASTFSSNQHYNTQSHATTDSRSNVEQHMNGYDGNTKELEDLREYSQNVSPRALSRSSQKDTYKGVQKKSQNVHGGPESKEKDDRG